jgi:hypothetical protein
LTKLLKKWDVILLYLSDCWIRRGKEEKEKREKSYIIL